MKDAHFPTSAAAKHDRGDAEYSEKLKPRHIQMIAIGGSIGMGLFLGADGRLAQGGPGLVVTYGICGIFTFLMVRALGELAIHRPSSGAFVSYACEFTGEKGVYVAGWMFLLDWAVTVMADVTAAALYMHCWTAFRGIPQWFIALVVLALAFALDLLSAKTFGEAEFWFAAIKVVTVVGFMAVAVQAIVVGHNVGGHAAGFHNITESGGFFPKGSVPIFALTLGIVFAFGGVGMVGVAAGETKEAERVFPKAINSMIVCIFVFYVGAVALMAVVLPYTTYPEDESPFVTFFKGIGVPHAGSVIQVVVLTAALSSFSAGLYATGRMLRSLAMAGSGPRFATHMSANHVPYGAIVITSALGLVGMLLNVVLEKDAFDVVMNLAAIGIAGTWAPILITHLALLRRVKAGKETRPSYRMPGAPVANYIALALFAVVVGSNLTSSEGRWTLAFFVPVIAMIIGGWHSVRGRMDGAPLDRVFDEEVAAGGGQAPSAGGER